MGSLSELDGLSLWAGWALSELIGSLSELDVLSLLTGQTLSELGGLATALINLSRFSLNWGGLS